MKKHWESDITDYEVVSDEKIDFIHDQVEGYLKWLMDSENKVDNKSLSFLGGLIAITITFLAYLHQLLSIQRDFLLVLPAIVCIFSFLIAIFILTNNFKPTKKKPLGNEPRNLLKQEVISYDLRLIKLSEIEHYQERCEQNWALVEYKAKNLEYAINVITYGLFLTTVLMSGLIIFC